jgi:hypothetical protein
MYILSLSYVLSIAQSVMRRSPQVYSIVKETAKGGSVYAFKGLRLALRTTLRMIRLVNGMCQSLSNSLNDSLMPDLESQETPPSTTSLPQTPKRPKTHKFPMESMIFSEDYLNT